MARITPTARLGDYFVAFRLATRKQIKDALADARPCELLGQVLVRAGVCSVAVCNDVAAVQKRYRKTATKLKQSGVEVSLDEKTLIGEILMALGVVSLEAKERWARYQDEERAKGNEAVPRLARLLVEKENVAEEDRLLAIRIQNWLRGVR